MKEQSKVPTKEQIKKRAKFLRELLREKYNVELSHSHALEVLAKVFGYKDWNTASALVGEASSEKTGAAPVVPKVSIEKPSAAKFQTMGEIVDFASKFDRADKLVVNEYQWSKLDPENFRTVTSECSLTYDSEIQSEHQVRFELRTEREVFDFNFGKSSTQRFERTPAGRSQRILKVWDMMTSRIWNPKLAAESFRKS